MTAGWGGFNVVEGLIDHQLLGIHHVLPGSTHELAFDLLFLGFGFVLLVTGARLMARSGMSEYRGNIRGSVEH
jgi:uncharacterized membrane protein